MVSWVRTKFAFLKWRSSATLLIADFAMAEDNMSAIFGDDLKTGIERKVAVEFPIWKNHSPRTYSDTPLSTIPLSQFFSCNLSLDNSSLVQFLSCLFSLMPFLSRYNSSLVQFLSRAILLSDNFSLGQFLSQTIPLSDNFRISGKNKNFTVLPKVENFQDRHHMKCRYCEGFE